jgi:hypothetical protein
MPVEGYEPYKPKEFTRKVLSAAKAVMIEYESWDNPMTIRQVFYRLVQEYKYAKTEEAYQSLIGYVARSRRAFQHRVLELFNDDFGDYQECTDEALSDPTLIPFSWVRDERGTSVEVTIYEDVPDFVEAVDGAIKSLQMNRQRDQPFAVELWCEAGGMVPLIASIARPYGLRVSSGGGYDSVTAKHKLAQRAQRRYVRGIETKVMHVGDFDPSGEGMFNTLVEDVGSMTAQLIGEADWITFNRIALTGEQVLDREIETAPPKPKDARLEGFIEQHMDVAAALGSYDIAAQLEALPPPELRKLLEDAIEAELDFQALTQVEEEEMVLREEIRERLGVEEEEE